MLGVKESVSGKRIALPANGDEVSVCGGKGSVYLSGAKVALRCCGKTSIVATRKLKQSVLRQGDVALLDLRDAFYANGTLTKYEVVEVDMAATHSVLLSEQYRQLRQYQADDSANSRRESTGQSSATKKRMASLVIVDDDEFSDASEANSDDKIKDNKTRVTEEEEDSEQLSRPAGPPVKKKPRVIVESDGEEEESGDELDRPSFASNTGEVESDVPSPREDDVFAHELKLKQESRAPAGGAANWMAAFAKGTDRVAAAAAAMASVKKHNSSSRLSSSMADKGWHSISDLKEKRKAQPAPHKHKFQGRSDGDDESEDDGHHTRTHDEVGQLLRDCEKIAEKLRQSIKSWSAGPSSGASPSSLSTSTNSADGDEDEGHVSIAAIASSAAEADRRVKQQGRVCRGPHLVIVPASVLSNWKREFAWIAPTLRVVVYHGAKDDRLALQDELEAGDFDVLLTTYSYFERDSCQDDRNFLRTFLFGYMILDEGHSIKNAKSSRFKRVSQLLLFFDGSEQKKCAKVRKILAPFILRREKQYVLSQLVAKTVRVEMLQPAAPQRKAYTDLLESVIKQKESEAARKAETKAHKKTLNNKFSRQMQGLLGLADATPSRGGKSAATPTDLSIFSQLRKAANHPALLRNHYVDNDVLTTMTRCLHRAEAFGTQCSLAMVRKELESYSDFALHDLCVQYGANEELRKLQLPIEMLLDSVKFDYLRGLLPKLHAEGHRVLIFSQWTKLLDLLEVLLDFMQYRFLRLDGSTDVAARQDLIDTFNGDTGIFLGESKRQLNHAVLGKLNAHSGDGAQKSSKASDRTTVEMLLASVISNYKTQSGGAKN
ncbi:hypothetical protein PybrP1_006182 [[Pythium] brassicae (nom. inval.)]|nr:hypothetical protein PybrP1_006182 [[Pythium] brassicae (nom. inval.)]